MSATTPLLIIVGYVWPEPKSSAAGYRMLSLIQLFLAKNWRVIFASAAELSLHRFALAELGVAEHCISLNDSSFSSSTHNGTKIAGCFVVNKISVTIGF